MPSFQEKLAVELDAREMGYRTLAKLIDPDNVETGRRSIRKWMTGKHQPSVASRAAVTTALGLEAGSLDSDEEEDLNTALFREMREARQRLERMEQMFESRTA